MPEPRSWRTTGHCYGLSVGLRCAWPNLPCYRASTIDQSRIPRIYLLRLLAQPGDAQAHGIARLQENRRGLAAHAHARRRAGADQVPGVQRHEAADVADQLRDAEHHGPGAAVLEALAIDLQPHVEILRVADFIGRHQPRADRAEGVAALALVPGAAPFELVLALGNVV